MYCEWNELNSAGRRRNKSAQGKTAQTKARKQKRADNKSAQDKTAPTKPRNINNHGRQIRARHKRATIKYKC